MNRIIVGVAIVSTMVAVSDAAVVAFKHREAPQQQGAIPSAGQFAARPEAQERERMARLVAEAAARAAAQTAKSVAEGASARLPQTSPD